MITIYVARGTESESGWGQRPDGYVIGKDEKKVLEKCKRIESNGTSYEYTRFDAPQLGDISEANFADLCGDDGVAWISNSLAEGVIRLITAL